MFKIIIKIKNKPNNLQAMQNQNIQQNIPRQVNPYHGTQLKAQPKPQKQLAVSHLPLGQTPNLEPPSQNQKKPPQTHIPNYQQQPNQQNQQNPQNQQNQQNQQKQPQQ